MVITEIGAVSHAGERILKANRMMRAQELSVVRRVNVDMSQLRPEKTNNRCVSAKRSFNRKLCLALSSEAPVSPHIR